MSIQTLSPGFDVTHQCLWFIKLYKNSITFWGNARIFSTNCYFGQPFSDGGSSVKHDSNQLGVFYQLHLVLFTCTAFITAFLRGGMYNVLH